MSHDHKSKDLILLMFTIGVVFPQFGYHKSLSPPEESTVDLITRYDLEAIARYDNAAINGEANRVHNFAMPCNVVINMLAGTSSLRRKPRFDDNVFIEEVVVDILFKAYSYAIKKIRTKALRPVIRDPNTMYARDLMSRAVARFRAIELANGR
eukprot:2705616-Heterocapsa_arctica.AAC.1